MKVEILNKPVSGIIKDIVIKNWQFEGIVLQCIVTYLQEYGVRPGKGASRIFNPEDRDYSVRVRQTKTKIIGELIPL